MESSKAEGKRATILDEDDEKDYQFDAGEDNSNEKRLSTPTGKRAGGSRQARCQVEDCVVDMDDAKQYHRRHKVCEFHAKAPVVFTGGLQQRFCQQCSRFHELSEFDEAKRSCRRRLAGHNQRRRKVSYD